MTAALAAWTLAKKYWPFAVLALLLIAIGVQTVRLNHAKADLATCAAQRRLDEGAIARMEQQSKADTAQAQAAIDHAAKGESAAVVQANAILRRRPGSPTDCASARQVILDALKAGR